MAESMSYYLRVQLGPGGNCLDRPLSITKRPDSGRGPVQAGRLMGFLDVKERLTVDFLSHDAVATGPRNECARGGHGEGA
jgi:hypothetical protein